MNKIFRRSISALTLAMLTMSATALDLPVRKVKGKEVYCYKVRNKETVYGVSKKLGVTREEIVRYNPSASDGLKKNMLLFFPVDVFRDRNGGEETVESIAEVPVCPDTVIAEEKIQVQANSKILIMLPFQAKTDSENRKARFSKDFYRGFLLAADSLSNRPGDISIEVLDISNTGTNLAGVTDSEAFRTASVIIGPEDEATLRTISEAASKNGSFVLNVLNMRDTTYLSNPFMIQANIQHQAMYELASRAIEENFNGYTPVILRSQNGRNEKEPFIRYFSDRCMQNGIEPVYITYDKILHMTDLASLPAEGAEKYVFIPSSGSLSEFNNTAHVIKAFKDKFNIVPEDETEIKEKGDVAVFGYPDWTAFRGDALDMLHKLEVTVYSRFCDDFSGFEAKNLENAFKHWYGTTMMESVPTPGLLGFDTGWYLIKNLRANGGAFNPELPSRSRGIQSVFQFVKPDAESGYVNNALYIIKYLPGGRLDARVI